MQIIIINSKLNWNKVIYRNVLRVKSKELKIVLTIPNKINLEITQAATNQQLTLKTAAKEEFLVKPHHR